MASHVVVLDASLRRVTVKTTPATHLSNVLDEACMKLGLKPEQYGLKHDNKQVDLSRTIRLSGLSSGAKLNLVQASRSPSVVSVALQLPTEAGSSGSLSRLTDKFPSNTPIWQILRRFEAGAAGAASAPHSNYNFTQRATPLMADGRSSGSGRLCYEMPVVTVIGRELGSFVELQKTLGQLGFTSGSCLLRLNYRNTQQPLEEAMTEISRYFKDTEEPAASPALHVEEHQESSFPEEQVSAAPTDPIPTLEPTLPLPPVSVDPTPPADPIIASDAESTPSGLSIFSPPSSTTPAAASQADYNEEDYVPTVVHAQQHQARLAAESRNRKLLSDTELETQQKARTSALSEVKEVVVRFRFPDQSQAQRSFGQDATSANLYALSRELMDRPGGEEFSIRIVGGKGTAEILREDAKKLIRDLGWQGRVLVTVVWGDNVSMQTRQRPCLKQQYRQQAETLKVELARSSQQDEGKEKGEKSTSKKSEGGGSKQDKESKMRGFLKGLSKK